MSRSLRTLGLRIQCEDCEARRRSSYTLGRTLKMKWKLILMFIFFEISYTSAAKQCTQYLSTSNPTGVSVDLSDPNNPKVTFPPTTRDAKAVSAIKTKYDAKGLDAFFNLAESFMNTVQKKEIPDLRGKNCLISNRIFEDIFLTASYKLLLFSGKQIFIKRELNSLFSVTFISAMLQYFSKSILDENRTFRAFKRHTPTTVLNDYLSTLPNIAHALGAMFFNNYLRDALVCW